MERKEGNGGKGRKDREREGRKARLHSTMDLAITTYTKAERSHWIHHFGIKHCLMTSEGGMESNDCIKKLIHARKLRSTQ